MCRLRKLNRYQQRSCCSLPLGVFRPRSCRESFLEELALNDLKKKKVQFCYHSFKFHFEAQPEKF